MAVNKLTQSPHECKAVQELRLCKINCWGCHRKKDGTAFDVREELYKCYFCKGYFCDSCAKDHFGEYERKRDEELLHEG